MLIKKKPNYEKKARILAERSDLLKDIKNAQFLDYQDKQLNENGVIINDVFRGVGSKKTMLDIFTENEANDVFEALRIVNAAAKRKQRMRERITQIYEDAEKRNNRCYFVTFTFSNDLLSKTSENTRRRYIQRVLKAYCSHYVANIDYGSENEREHYHAFLSTEPSLIDMLKSNYYMLTQSFIHIEKLRVYNNMNKTYRKLSLYISKLTNHAIKRSVKRNVYIYDRNKFYTQVSE